MYNAHTLDDVQRLESLQRRATKMVPLLRDKPYHEATRITASDSRIQKNPARLATTLGYYQQEHLSRSQHLLLRLSREVDATANS